MFDLITTISTNLFRTFIIYKFMRVFFSTEIENKRKLKAAYALFFFVTAAIYLWLHLPIANMLTNIIMIYLIAQLYEGQQRKKVLVTFLIYGINMICDTFSVFCFSNYRYGEEYNLIAAYVTVLLISICEFVVERFLIKNKTNAFTPPYWNILITIPIVSIIILSTLVTENLNNRSLLLSISAGILIINLLIFYLYNALLETYLKLEEKVILERQIVGYSNQLDILMQSEEKVTAIRHDMKHHLNELLSLANQHRESEIKSYIHDMQGFMETKGEYVHSGNKEIDSILNYMLGKAENVLDSVDYEVNIPIELGIRPFDINVIFGNLLDNAILAASQSKDKWLWIHCDYEKGMLFIQIKNSYDTAIVIKNEKYITTKMDEKEHGIGLQNVKRVVESYQGTIEITNDKNVFDVKIILYVTLG